MMKLQCEADQKSASLSIFASRIHTLVTAQFPILELSAPERHTHASRSFERRLLDFWHDVVTAVHTLH